MIITEQELNELAKLTPKTDKGSVNNMINIYNKYNTPTLDGCTCGSSYRISSRKTVLNWYNSIINPELNGN